MEQGIATQEEKVDFANSVLSVLGKSVLISNPAGRSVLINAVSSTVYDLMPEDVRNGKRALTISSRKIATALGIPRQTISYQLNKAIDRGYLKNVQMLPGRPTKLKLGADFDPKKIQPDEILPTLEQIIKCTAE